MSYPDDDPESQYNEQEEIDDRVLTLIGKLLIRIERLEEQVEDLRETTNELRKSI